MRKDRERKYLSFYKARCLTEGLREAGLKSLVLGALIFTHVGCRIR